VDRTVPTDLIDNQPEPQPTQFSSTPPPRPCYPHPARDNPATQANITRVTFLARALFGLVAGAVRRQPHDMSLTSLSTLTTLEVTGPGRITDLAASEGVTQPSMTALVTTLERSGLVKRRSDPSDRRVTLVTLTPDGMSYIRELRQAGVEDFAQLISELPVHEAAALAEAVTALTHLKRLDEDRRSLSPPSSTGEPRR
jgi:DNA-binding MarR family transcriptional regulator